MKGKIGELKEIHRQVIEAIDRFPVEKRELVLFDKWSLKDVVAHLNTWMEHDLECLEKMKEGVEPYWEPSIQVFNERGVRSRKGWSWERLYEELTALSGELMAMYGGLAEEMWEKKIWEGKNQTPRRFIEDDIRHWKGEHLGEIIKRI